MFVRFIVASLVVGLALAGKPSWKDLGNYSFEKFTEDFNMKYLQSEIGARRALFNTELARVREHNSKNHSWKEGINKFSAMTAVEKKVYHGRHKGAAHHQKLTSAKTLPENFEMKELSELPKNVDWREKGKVFYYY